MTGNCRSNFRWKNYPNPFNPSTRIAFELPTAATVKLTVFNLAGQEVAKLVNEQRNAGRHEITFEAGNLPSGIYFYRIQAGNYISTRKMMLVR
ncbi:MAG: T9SS type A sorting domain-containing protein [Calditrichae bacterium]|nr:T9SS type A sorting domain-containing protein [Calditrichia bacterium]